MIYFKARETDFQSLPPLSLITGRQTVSVLTLSVTAWKANLSNKFFLLLQQEQGDHPLKHCAVFITS